MLDKTQPYQFEAMQAQIRISKTVHNTVLQLLSKSHSVQIKDSYSDLTDVKEDSHVPNSAVNDARKQKRAKNMRYQTKDDHKSIYRQKKKLAIRILKAAKLKGKAVDGLQRSYFMEYRRGNEAYKLKKLVNQGRILDEDPQLLIEQLIDARRAVTTLSEAMIVF